MSFHCNHCGKKIDPNSGDDNHDLMPAMMCASVSGGRVSDDGTLGTIDALDTGNSFSFTICAADQSIEEHYHRACALYILKGAIVATLSMLAINGEVPRHE